MLVKRLIGRYAGEVADMPSLIALRLIEDGGAVPFRPEIRNERTDEEPMAAVKTARRRRGRPRKTKKE